MDNAAPATAEDMLRFVNNNLGTFRLLDGSLTTLAGRIDEVDTIISSTTKEQVEENLVESLKKFFEETANSSNTQRAESATMYYQIASAALRKGLDYITQEHNREVEMLQKKHIRTPKKNTKHSIRLNILKVFKGHYNL